MKMMRVRVIGAAVLLVVTALLSAVGSGSLLEPLSSQPHIQCAACLAVAEHVGQKMNESAKLKTSFQASHRLDARNKVKRIDYESSELRAHEILDGLCNEMEKEYHLRLGDNGLRLFSKNKTLPRADYYGKNDRKELKSVTKRMKDICMEITEEQDHIVIEVIKTKRELDDVQRSLCFSEGFKCCGTKKVEESRQKERERRSKWEELRKAKELKQKLKEERDRQRKEAAEAAKKKAEEEEAAKKREEETLAAAAAADVVAAADTVEPSTLPLEQPEPPAAPDAALGATEL